MYADSCIAALLHCTGRGRDWDELQITLDTVRALTTLLARENTR